jgi:hypothetical protein
MRYRNIKPDLMHINELSSNCGLSKLDYRCRSQSKYKQEPGRCFAWDCPLAWEADLNDLKVYDLFLYDEYAKGGYEVVDWVVQYRKKI